MSRSNSTFFGFVASLLGLGKTATTAPILPAQGHVKSDIDSAEVKIQCTTFEEAPRSRKPIALDRAQSSLPRSFQAKALKAKARADKKRVTTSLSNLFDRKDKVYTQS